MLEIFFFIDRLIDNTSVRWGAVAEWLESTTDDRVVTGSNPTEAA